MLDRLIERWLAEPYSPVLAVEHARAHVLPRGAQQRVLDDSTITIYRAPLAVPTVVELV